jgi:molybdopterin biosynthesis enzyme
VQRMPYSEILAVKIHSQVRMPYFRKSIVPGFSSRVVDVGVDVGNLRLAVGQKGGWSICV